MYREEGRTAPRPGQLERSEIPDPVRSKDAVKPRIQCVWQDRIQCVWQDREMRDHGTVGDAQCQVRPAEAGDAEGYGGGTAGPMTAAVLVAQNRAITIARDATTARVLALELLAAQVAAAEAARRDWETSHRMAANNDKYLDLVARTAADQRATAEITGLAEQAAEAAQAFRETLQRATLAAEALALPESR